MEALAAPGDELGDRRILPGAARQLDVALADRQQGLGEATDVLRRSLVR